MAARPLWERALLTRQLEQAGARVALPKRRTKPPVSKDWPRVTAVAYTRIGNGFYIRLGCGHTVRRRRIPEKYVICVECRTEERARVKRQEGV